MIYGYARVSTVGQSLEAQIEILKKAGAEKIFSDKMSGVRSDLPNRAKMLKQLERGDTVLVVRMSRLARSLRETFKTADAILERGAVFRSLTEAWADPKDPIGRYVFTTMAGFNELNRELILETTREGREHARASGKPLGGPKPKLTAHQQREALKELGAGATLRAVADRYNVSIPTIWRLQAKAEASTVED